jgi:hypothetical protein
VAREADVLRETRARRRQEHMGPDLNTRVGPNTCVNGRAVKQCGGPCSGEARGPGTGARKAGPIQPSKCWGKGVLISMRVAKLAGVLGISVSSR